MDPSVLQSFSSKNSGLLGAIAAGSLLFALLGAALGPLIVSRLPEDYFTSEAMRTRLGPARGPGALALRVLRNVAGWPLLFIGIVLLVLPGQGILTIIAALALMDFPMKRRVMQKLLHTERVRSGLNWLRRLAKKKPFRWD